MHWDKCWTVILPKMEQDPVCLSPFPITAPNLSIWWKWYNYLSKLPHKSTWALDFREKVGPGIRWQCSQREDCLQITLFWAQRCISCKSQHCQKPFCNSHSAFVNLSFHSWCDFSPIKFHIISSDTSKTSHIYCINDSIFHGLKIFLP